MTCQRWPRRSRNCARRSYLRHHQIMRYYQILNSYQIPSLPEEPLMTTIDGWRFGLLRTPGWRGRELR